MTRKFTILMKVDRFNPDNSSFANAVGTQADLITHYGPGGSFNTLFNGKNINPVGPGGDAFQWTVTPCRKHLFRIINRSVRAFALFSSR
jgi:hypothetical protein